MTSNKRNRGEMEDTSIAKFLMLLSSGRGEVDPQPVVQTQTTWRSSRNRAYQCKTCNRQFPSFQALGGHRASHKKPRILVNLISSDSPSGKQQMTKPKTHECSICGLEFSVGQALGGHMRKHRAMVEISSTTEAAAARTTELSSSSSDITNSTTHEKQPLIPGVKKSKNRILSFDLDLNLSDFPTTTMDSNDFEFCNLVAPHRQTSLPLTIYSFI